MKTYNVPNITLIARALRQRTAASIYYTDYHIGTHPKLTGTRSQVLNQARSLAQHYTLGTTEGLYQYVTPLEKSAYHQSEHDAYLAGLTADIAELLSGLDNADRAKVLHTFTTFRTSNA